MPALTQHQERRLPTCGCIVSNSSLTATCVVCVLRVQVYPTQRVVLRSRCSKATVQLVGYALSSAPAQIKVGTVQQTGFRTKA